MEEQHIGHLYPRMRVIPRRAANVTASYNSREAYYLGIYQSILWLARELFYFAPYFKVYKVDNRLSNVPLSRQRQRVYEHMINELLYIWYYIVNGRTALRSDTYGIRKYMNYYDKCASLTRVIVYL